MNQSDIELDKAIQAFTRLIVQLNVLTGIIEKYRSENPVTPYPESDRTANVLRELLEGTRPLTTLPVQIANEIKMWTLNQKRLFTELGFYEDIIIEFWCNLVSIHRVLVREKIDLENFEVLACENYVKTLTDANSYFK